MMLRLISLVAVSALIAATTARADDKVRQAIEDATADLTLEPTDVETSGDLAYVIGNFSIQIPAENKAMVPATGNYLQVWRRSADGTWHLQVETWNDAPAK